MCVALYWVILVFQGGLVETEKESERVLLHRVLLHNHPKSATCRICSYHFDLISPLFDFFFSLTWVAQDPDSHATCP